MSVNDSATLVLDTGNYFTAPTGTAIPGSLTAPSAPWTNVGHTSLEDIFGVSTEGGDKTTLGTLQNKTLRTKYSKRTDTLTFTLQQFDTASLKLYYGSNATILPGGEVGVPEEPVPTTCAFLAVFIDQSNHFAFYAPKAEIFRADDLSLSDTESLAGLPLGVTPLVDGSNDWTYAVTPLA